MNNAIKICVLTDIYRELLRPASTENENYILQSCNETLQIFLNQFKRNANKYCIRFFSDNSFSATENLELLLQDLSQQYSKNNKYILFMKYQDIRMKIEIWGDICFYIVEPFRIITYLDQTEGIDSVSYIDTALKLLEDMVIEDFEIEGF